MTKMSSQNRKPLALQWAMALLSFGVAPFATLAGAEPLSGETTADNGQSVLAAMQRSEPRRSVWHRSGEGDRQSWSILATRVKTSRRSEGLPSGMPGRETSWTLEAHYGRPAGPFGTLGLFGDAALARRSLPGTLDIGHAVGSRHIAGGVEWRGDDGGHISLGLYDNRSTASRDTVEAALERAVRAPPSGRGVSLSMHQPLWGPRDSEGREMIIGVEAHRGRANFGSQGPFGAVGNSMVSDVAVTLGVRF